MPQYWGKGYATESSIAAKDYFFEHFKGKKLCGIAELDNGASCRILEKIGLTRKDDFFCEAEKMTLAWYESNGLY
jgi:ribosomal-protein-alanine N-acetyltransferase